MSTERRAPRFDLDRAWQLHPQVSIRPERFGALLYHFGTRRLSFLKSPQLLDVVQRSGRRADRARRLPRAGVAANELPSYAAALATLAASQHDP